MKAKRVLTFLYIFLFTTVVLNATVFTSVQSGSWNVSSTWDKPSPQKPEAGDTVIISSGHTVDMSANNSCARLTVENGGTLNIRSYEITISEDIIVNGNVEAIIGSKIHLTGNNTIIDGTGDIATSSDSTTILIENESKTITDSADLSINGNIIYAINDTIYNNGNISIDDDLEGKSNSSVWMNNAGSKLAVGESLFDSDGTLNASASNNTVVYNGESQDIKDPVSSKYYNLKFSGSNDKQLQRDVTIDGDLTVQSGIFKTNSYDIKMRGDWINQGTFEEENSIVIFDGSVGQNIHNPSGERFYDLKVDKTNGVLNVNDNITISDSLYMINGNIITNDTVTLGTEPDDPGGLVYNSGTVTGKFERWIDNTGKEIIFPIGTSSHHRPLRSTLNKLSEGGSLVAEFINSNPGTAGIDSLLQEDSLSIEDTFNEGYWRFAGRNSLITDSYNIRVDAAGFTSYDIVPETRLLTRNNDTSEWTLEGEHVPANGITVKRDSLSILSAEFALADTISTDSILIPGKPPQPSGTDSICRNIDEEIYTTNSTPGAKSYEWDIIDGGNSSISGSDTTGVLMPDTSYSGSLGIRVRGVNGNGNNNGNGSGSWSDTLNVMILSEPVVLIASNTPVCEGNNINLNESGGDASDWSWSGPNSFSSTAQSPTRTSVTNADSGRYYVTITDANGCTNVDSVDITVYPKDTAIAEAADSTLCVGESLDLAETGSINGTDWNWSGPDGYSNTNRDPAGFAATESDSGRYYVTVTYGNGCTVGDSIDITVYPKDTAIAEAADSTLCVGESLDLAETGSINGTGWNWSGPDSYTSTQQDPASFTASKSDSGRYYVTVTYGEDCTNVDSVNVTVNTIPNVTAGSNSPVCEGDSIQLTESGGDATNWNWNGPNGFHSSSQDTSIAHAALSNGGTYYVTGSHGGGCNNVDSIEVTVKTMPSVTAGSNSPVCKGDSIQLAETGGNAINWNWKGPQGFTSTKQNPAIPNATTANDGNYYITITGTNNCTHTDTTSIHVGNPVADGGSSQVICKGKSVQIGGNPTATGTGPFTYAWKPSTNLSNDTLATPIAHPSSSSIYTVTITDTYGCKDTAKVSVDVYDAPQANAGMNLTICEDSTITLGGSPTAAGGTPPYTYSWEPSSKVYPDDASNPTTTPASNTTYTVTVIDSNNCSDTASTTISIVERPHIQLGNDTGICRGTTLALEADTGYNQYKWSNGSTQHTIYTDSAGIYSITVTNGYGCKTRDSIMVTVNPLPKADFDSYSECGFIEFENQSTISSGKLSAKWIFDSRGATSHKENPVYNVTQHGAIDQTTLIVTSDKGCSDSLTQPVTSLIMPEADFTYAQRSKNVNTNIQFTNKSTHANQWHWDFGDESGTSEEKNPAYVYPKPGKYEVTLEAKNEDNCMDTVSHTIAIANPVVMPSAFSPNDDGVNDVLHILGGPFKKVKMNIYNKYGNLIFSTNNQNNGWDGTQNGEKQPPGVYIYTVSGETLNGKTFQITGDVTLIR